MRHMAAARLRSSPAGGDARRTFRQVLRDGTLTGGDVCLGLVDAGLDLLAGFLPGLVEGTLQLRRPLLQGVYLVRKRSLGYS
jgi:hypothetical protein